VTSKTTCNSVVDGRELPNGPPIRPQSKLNCPAAGSRVARVDELERSAIPARRKSGVERAWRASRLPLSAPGRGDVPRRHQTDHRHGTYPMTHPADPARRPSPQVGRHRRRRGAPTPATTLVPPTPGRRGDVSTASATSRRCRSRPSTHVHPVLASDSGSHQPTAGRPRCCSRDFQNHSARLSVGLAMLGSINGGLDCNVGDVDRRGPCSAGQKCVVKVSASDHPRARRRRRKIRV
jgi:hypothetical protein